MLRKKAKTPKKDKWIISQLSVTKYFSKAALIFSLLFFAVIFSGCISQKRTGPKPIWLAVTKPMFIESLKPLAEKRKSEGFKTIIPTESVSEAISALPQKPAFLLLVGDCQAGQESQPWYIPSQMCTLYRWSRLQANNFASDAVFGDFDNDFIPDIPVGRLPVRTKEQLELLVTKIIKYENKPPSRDDFRIPMYTGTSGYSAVYDSMTTQLLLDTINTNAAPWLQPWIISANLTHPLCGWPEEQGQIFTEQLKAGGLMAVFMGHGSIEQFHSMTFNGKSINYGAEQAAEFLNEGTPAPPTVVFTCYSGNFTASKNCLTESLLFMPSGPVAAIGATTESHPMTNYFSGLCLLRQPGEPNQVDKRLGTFWLESQKQAMKARNIIIEAALRDIEGKLEDKINTDKLRRDQILMYALLGDPASKIRMPDCLSCQIEPGENNYYWKVEKPRKATKLYVEFRPDGQSFPQVQSPLEKDSAHQNLIKANDTFAFNKVAELEADEIWEGTVNTSGTLRLVAIAPDKIYVAAKKIDLKIQK